MQGVLTHITNENKSGFWVCLYMRWASKRDGLLSINLPCQIPLSLSFVSLTLVQKGRNHLAKYLNGARFSPFYQSNFIFDHSIKCNECYSTKCNHGTIFFSETALIFTCSKNRNTSKFMRNSKNHSTPMLISRSVNHKTKIWYNLPISRRLGRYSSILLSRKEFAILKWTFFPRRCTISI